MNARLGDLAAVVAGVGFPERLQGRRSGRYPFFKVGDISQAWQANRKVLLRAEHYVDDADLRELRARPLPAGTTVFAKIGAAVALNRRAVLSEPSLVDNNCFGVVPDEKRLDPLFLFYFLCSVDFGARTRATTVPSLRKGDVEELNIPDLTLTLQEGTVQAIETLFSRLVAAVASLNRAKANVKRARASILQAAIEGRLVPTEAALARAEGRDFEPASLLLGRILTERRALWNVGSLRGAYPEPLAPTNGDMESLPEGWSFATVDQCATSIGYGSSAKCSAEHGVPVLRMGNLVEGRLELSNLKYLPVDHSEFPGQLLEPGELLFNRTNSPELVGKTAIYKGFPRPCASASYLIRVKMAGRIEPEYVSVAVNSTRGRLWVKAVVTQQVGQANVNGSKLKAYTLPLPPSAEQTRIVAEVERRLSVLDTLAATIDANLARCGRLRESILQRAFSGQLVPPESVPLAADEPRWATPESKPPRSLAARAV